MIDALSVRSYTDIKGWFQPVDKDLFELLLAAPGEPGVVVELGAYLGRSAVVIGDGLRPGERFVVLDLFGGDADAGGAAEDDDANRAENQRSYATLTRSQFEANYLALHDTLPEVVQALSTEIVKHVEPRSVRFMHIDASHLYPQVIDDIRCAQDLLRDDGVVVFDDYRALHTPGVAAAVWEAVATLGLHPFATTASKLYASWGDPTPHYELVLEFGRSQPGMWCHQDEVRGSRLVALRRKSGGGGATPTPSKSAGSKDAAALTKRIAQLEQRMSGMRPARRPLLKTRAKDLPAPLRPVLTRAWHALPASTRKKIRRAR